MLKAKKNVLFERFFSVYNRNLINRRFHSIQVSGIAEFNERNLKIPLIIYANHSSWWDGLVAFEISGRAKLNSFVVMEERQLKKLFLFRFLGAFSVNREKPREAIKTINYAVEILEENPGRTIWIFPQGKILPNDQRPIYFYNGLSRIIEKVPKVQIVPLAIRYEFLNEFKPKIFAKIGRIQLIEVSTDLTSKTMTETLAGTLTGILDELKYEIVSENFDGFEKII
jgi:chlorobactene lauroyltransferase